LFTQILCNYNGIYEERKKEEGRRKKEEGRRKKEEGRRKKEEGRRKKEGKGRIEFEVFGR